MRAGPDTLLNDADGETVDVLRRPDDDDDALVLRIALERPGAGPPPHAHPLQTEAFRVTAGSLYLEMGRAPRLLAAGDAATVPPGVVHAWRAGSAGTRVEITMRPGLRFEATLERAFALRDSGAIGPRGVHDAAAVDAFLAEFADEYRLAAPAGPRDPEPR